MVGIYDGDTPTHRRPRLRAKGRMLLTPPLRPPPVPQGAPPLGAIFERRSVRGGGRWAPVSGRVRVRWGPPPAQVGTGACPLRCGAHVRGGLGYHGCSATARGTAPRSIGDGGGPGRLAAGRPDVVGVGSRPRSREVPASTGGGSVRVPRGGGTADARLPPVAADGGGPRPGCERGIACQRSAVRCGGFGLSDRRVVPGRLPTRGAAEAGAVAARRGAPVGRLNVRP